MSQVPISFAVEVIGSILLGILLCLVVASCLRAARRSTLSGGVAVFRTSAAAGYVGAVASFAHGLPALWPV